MKKTKNFYLLGILPIAALSIMLLSIAPPAIADGNEAVIKITAKKFEYSPREITLKKGVPVVLEFTSLDRLHGFYCPGLGIRTDIVPGKSNQISFTPEKTGTFPFHCDIFCGENHEDMTGTITVAE
jgi:cytochrome c oxidase subunit II